MTAGELVINIIVKGAEKTTNALKNTKDWLTDLSAAGIAAKASILGAFYALERLSAASGSWGNQVKNISLGLGIGTTPLQQWREYFREKGGKPEDADSILRAAAKIQGEALQGHPLPAGTDRVSQQTGVNILAEALKGNVLGIADALKKYVQTTKDPASLVNSFTASIGATEEANAIFRKKVKGAPENIYSITKNIANSAEIDRLERVNQAYLDLEKSLSRLRDAFAETLVPVIDALARATELINSWIGGSKVGIPLTPQKKENQEPESEISKTARRLLKPFFGEPPIPGQPGGKLPDHVIAPSQKPLIKGERRSENNVKIDVYQNGIKDTHDSVASLESDVSLAWQGIASRAQIT